MNKEDLFTSEVEKILIISIANIEGGSSGWRFKEDAENDDFAADILDEAFLGQIRARKITLGRGDMLQVKLTGHMILSVLAYIPYEELEE